MRKLEFTLDRKSLNVISLSVIRPLIGYADIVWINCTQFEKLEFDKIQNAAARIVSGATKLVSLRELQKEVLWKSVESQRQNHKLILFYKMRNGLTPDYLSS
jgi:hypothetical protein